MISHPLDRKYKRRPILLGVAKKGALLHYLDKGFPDAYRIWFLKRDGRRKSKLDGNRELIPIRLCGFEHRGFNGQSDWLIKRQFKFSGGLGHMDSRYLVHVRTKRNFRPSKKSTTQ